ncbi:(2Fe-2S)-binding protein [Burkholderia sp. FERM BP-3421]|uniref:(2Fe-2S)-binding protein n=1 Tax=Burkholderia sp. FERM BP-3421 TaxID=1494466 RepID=UPI00236028DB|nr:(2Fe-2S)-binding protein [Burkholderia sp. FERM BP-3421]WDD91397.1 (2Fe-2S)-binding protein [Burkholderia sp. FERM BP-3421]
MRDANLILTIDGRPLTVAAGSTVAAALVLAGGVRGTRASVSGAPRTMVCGMGVCQECRVTIDGRAHVLACQTLCRDGMAVDTTFNGQAG